MAEFLKVPGDRMGGTEGKLPGIGKPGSPEKLGMDMLSTMMTLIAGANVDEMTQEEAFDLMQKDKRRSILSLMATLKSVIELLFVTNSEKCRKCLENGGACRRLLNLNNFQSILGLAFLKLDVFKKDVAKEGLEKWIYDRPLSEIPDDPDDY